MSYAVFQSQLKEVLGCLVGGFTAMSLLSGDSIAFTVRRVDCSLREVCSLTIIMNYATTNREDAQKGDSIFNLMIANSILKKLRFERKME